MPLRFDAREELAWYFGQRRKVDVGGVGGRSGTVPTGGPPVPRASIPGALQSVEEGRRCDSARDRLSHSRRRPDAADGADRKPRAAALVSASLPLGWLSVGSVRERVKGGRQARELSAPHGDACSGRVAKRVLKRIGDETGLHVVGQSVVTVKARRTALCAVRMSTAGKQPKW